MIADIVEKMLDIGLLLLIRFDPYFSETLANNGGHTLGTNRVILQRNAMRMCPKYKCNK